MFKIFAAAILAALLSFSAVACAAQPDATATTGATPAPTATDAPPTATATDAPPTATATDAPPTATATDAPPTATATPTDMPTATSAPTATPALDRLALLEGTARIVGEALANGDWLVVHSFLPDEYKAKCSSEDFLGLMAFLQIFGAVPQTDGMVYVLDDVSIDGDNGFVVGHFEKYGVEVDFLGSESSENDDPNFIWHDGQWERYISPEDMADDNPCEVSGTAPEETIDEPTPAPTLASAVTPSPTQIPERQALLEQKAKIWGLAFGNHDWVTVYSTEPEGFKSKCTVAEYAEYISFLNTNSPVEVPMGATYVLDGVRIEGEYAWVDSHFEIDGQKVYHDTNQYDSDEPPEAVWVNGQWEFAYSEEILSLENPCDLTRFMGFTLDLPLPVGSTIHGVDGTEVIVTGIVEDAWDIIQARSSYASPPDPGNLYYLISLEIKYVKGQDSREFGRSDFNLVGNNRTIYDGFYDDCGSVPNRLDADLFPGGKAEGNICFQVDGNESGFILIHQPEYSAASRRFLSLE